VKTVSAKPRLQYAQTNAPTAKENALTMDSKSATITMAMAAPNGAAPQAVLTTRFASQDSVFSSVISGSNYTPLFCKAYIKR